MSAVWENTNVIQMLNVEITLDPTAANVKRDFQGMAKRAQVSFDYYPSGILYKSRTPSHLCVTRKGLYMSLFPFQVPFIL